MKKTRTDPAIEKGPPTRGELAALLGDAHAAFARLTARAGGRSQEWKRYSKAGPWVLKVARGDRTLFYATPKTGAFEVTVVLGERATQLALGGGVSKTLHPAIRAAKPYVEGRPVRVMVTNEGDLAGVEQLVAVKLNPAGEA